MLHAFKNDLAPQLPLDPVIWAAIHVNDAAQVIANIAVSNFDGFCAVNSGYREIYSIKRLIDIVCELNDCKYTYNINQPDFEFDLTLAKKLGAVPTHGLKEMISKFSMVI